MQEECAGRTRGDTLSLMVFPSSHPPLPPMSKKESERERERVSKERNKKHNQSNTDAKNKGGFRSRKNKRQQLHRLNTSHSRTFTSFQTPTAATREETIGQDNKLFLDWRIGHLKDRSLAANGLFNPLRLFHSFKPKLLLGERKRRKKDERTSEVRGRKRGHM